ncbi:MAG: hypothetical protein RLZZ574_1650 [Cyanobacteriota bacterium]|jgi:hypothetical protein
MNLIYDFIFSNTRVSSEIHILLIFSFDIYLEDVVLNKKLSFKNQEKVNLY